MARPRLKELPHLAALLWRSITDSSGQVLEPLPETLGLPDPSASNRTALRDITEVTADEIREALEAAGANKTDAAQRLGLRNRFQLLRLMKKHGLD